MQHLLAEYRRFFSCPRDMRVLLAANMVYAFVLPVLNIFVGAYVMRKSHDVTLVVACQLAAYTSIPGVFLLNGVLLRYFQVKQLYSAGMVLGGMAMVALMWLGELDLAGVVLVGAAMGMATGVCWANRSFLALTATTDENRNYYYGLENAFSTVTSVVVPLAAGWLVEYTQTAGWLGGRREHAYYVLTFAVLLLTLLASAIVHRGRFTQPPRARFVYLRFHRLWNRLQVLAALKGLAQGYVLTAPAMLILHVARGEEGVLGTIVAAGGIVTAVMLYAIGRLAGRHHRTTVLAAGLVLFAVGGSFHAALFNPLGVWLFMLCMLVGSPLLDFAYAPLLMRAIDTVSALERRNPFAYLANHEFGLYAGRFAGLGLFLVLVRCVTCDFALRYCLLVVGVIQLLSIPVAKSLCRGCEAADEEARRTRQPHAPAFGQRGTRRLAEINAP